MDNIIVATNTDIKKQKAKLKGKNRHNPQETIQFQRMNLQKYNVMVNNDTVFSTSVYNNIREVKRRSIREEDRKGKWKRKTKKHNNKTIND